MPNILIFFYNYVGNAALIPTYLFCVGLFSVGWVRPHAAYPATSLGLAFQLGWVRPHGTPGKIHRTSHTMMEQSLSHCHRNRMKSLRSDVPVKASTIKMWTPCENPAGYAEHLNILLQLCWERSAYPNLPFLCGFILRRLG